MSGINPNEDYAHTLKLLFNMGFTDLELSRKACHAAGGVLALSVEYLTNGIPEKQTESNGNRHSSITARPIKPSAHNGVISNPKISRYTFPKLENDQAQKVLQCAGMGFSDEGKIRHALSNSNWKVEQAVELLLNDVGLESSYSSFESMVSPGISLGSKSNLASSKSNLASSKSNLSNVYTASSTSNTPRTSQSNSNFHISQTQDHFHSSLNNSAHNPFGGPLPMNGNDPKNTSYDLFMNPEAAKTVPVFEQHSKTTPQNYQSNENPFDEKVNAVQPSNGRGVNQKAKNQTYTSEFDPFSDDNKI